MHLEYYQKAANIDLLKLSVVEGTPIYIGEVNEQHMRNRHEYEYDKYHEEIPTIIEEADYVGVSPHDNSIMYVKEYVECGEYIRVGVKVAHSGNYFARTLHLLSTYNAERYIEKGTLKKIDKNTQEGIIKL